MKMMQHFYGDLYLDWNFGLQAFAKYLHELDLVERGVAKMSDFGYSEERNKKPEILQIADEIKGERSLRFNPNVNIAELSLRGVMRLESGMSHRGVRELANDIYALEDVDGILLDINSGGGESVSANILKNALRDFNGPVVAYGHIIGSAAYNASLGADEIILSGKNAVAGSIGSLITIDKKMVEFIKENFEDIYSDTSPNKNKSFRDLLDGKYEEMRKSVTQNANIFREEVRQDRKLDDRSANVEEALAGGIFYAEKAKSLGLVDGIGTKNYAISRLLYHINTKL